MPAGRLLLPAVQARYGYSRMSNLNRSFMVVRVGIATKDRSTKNGHVVDDIDTCPTSNSSIITLHTDRVGERLNIVNGAPLAVGRNHDFTCLLALLESGKTRRANMSPILARTRMTCTRTGRFHVSGVPRDWMSKAIDLAIPFDVHA